MTCRESAARSWCQAHDGPVVGLVMGALTGVLLVGADGLLPVPGTDRALPVWQLIPAFFATLSSLTTTNRLPSQTGARRVLAARAGWCSAVVASAGLCVLVVDRLSGLPPVAPVTMAMVAATFAAAPVLGRGSVVLGAAAMVWIVSNAHRFAGEQNPWRLDRSLFLGVFAGLVALGLGAYVVRGGRHDRTISG